jgi:Zn-dependent M28 family amino/carboxypeptidase
MAFGPRVTGSSGHAQVIDWIQSQLRSSGWDVELQETERFGHTIKNIIGKRASNTVAVRTGWIILGAHFDTRMIADHDPDPEKVQQPVPGANDGASGVAVLLEIARVLPKDTSKDIWLVFFDAEDNGNIPGWDWILGSRAFAENLDSSPDVVVVIDMVGDRDLNLYYEANSNQVISRQIWSAAADLGYEQFIPSVKYRMLDDHIPFIQQGIPAVDIIDFDYPYWHTSQDTLDKVSAESLEAVGVTLIRWIQGEY